MRKKKPTPAEAGIGTKTVASYYPVVAKPTEDKNGGKPLKNAKIAALSEINDTKDNSTTMTTTTNITTTTRPEEVTTTETNTAPADEEDELEQGNTDIEVSVSEDEQEEYEEESEDEVAVNVDDQKSHFNNGTEKVTNMGTDTVTTNKGIQMEDNTDATEEWKGEKTQSKEMMVEVQNETYSLFGVGGKRNENQKDRTNIIHRGSMTEIEKDGKDNINENSNNKSSIGTEEATNTEANTEEIGGSKLRQHVNRFHKEGATAAHKEEMEEKNKQKTNEDDKEMKNYTETEEATNTEANTETIGVLGLQQEERERKGGLAAKTKEPTMEDKTKAGKADRQQEDKRDVIDAQTEVKKLRARTYKSTKCGQGIVI